MDEAHKRGRGSSPSKPNDIEINATLDPQFTPDVLCLKFNQGGAGIRTTEDPSFFLSTMANIFPQMIDSTDAKGATTRGLFSILKPTVRDRSTEETTKNNAGRKCLQRARCTGFSCETSGYHCSSNTPRW
jgi:hypothetical protein